MDYREYLIYLSKQLNIKNDYLSNLILYGYDKEYTKEQIDIINRSYNKYKNQLIEKEYYRIYVIMIDKTIKDKIKALNNELIRLNKTVCLLEPEKLEITQKVLIKLYNINIIEKNELFNIITSNDFILPITKDIITGCNLNNKEYAEYYFNNRSL